MSFLTTLTQAIAKNNSLLCVGLDTNAGKIPKFLLKEADPAFSFNKSIIDKTADLVCCYKLNIAFYLVTGVRGLEALKATISYIHDRYTGIPVIVDGKWGDIVNTSAHLAKFVFDKIEADGATVNPYLGLDSVEPFLKRRGKGVFILCRTSNPGASDFQNTGVSIAFHLTRLPDGQGGACLPARQGTDMPPLEKTEPLYLTVARKAILWNNKYGNVMLVVGPTGSDEIVKIRAIAPDMFFLVPGIGAQGGDLAGTLKAGLTKGKSGLIIHSARAILYASEKEDFAEAARKEAEKLRDEINTFRK